MYSAGGIVIKKTSSEPLILVTQHSGHKGWEFPKGHLELNESSEAAALREVEEETGVKAKILEDADKIQYFYFEDNKRVSKTVAYFLMEYVGDGISTTPEEVMDLEWLPVEKVEERLTYKDTKELWNKIKDRVGQII